MTPNSLISAHLTLLVNIITAEIILSPPKFQAVNTTDVAQLMTAGCPKLSHLPVLDLEYVIIPSELQNSLGMCSGNYSLLWMLLGCSLAEAGWSHT